MEAEAKGFRLLWQLFLAFLKLGLFTIGGGLAMIPLLERICVEEKKWLTQEEMVDCLAVCQSMPGVLAVNMATYIGNKKARFAGAVVTTIGVVIPSFVIIIAVSNLFDSLGDNRYVHGAFTGIKAGLCGLILATVIRIGKNNLKDAFCWVIAIACFVVIALLGVNAVFAILGSGVLGIIYHLIVLKREGADGKGEE